MSRCGTKVNFETRLFSKNMETQFGDRLKSLMDEKGIKQQFVADALGVARNTVSNWVTGRSRVTIDEASRLADVLGVDLDHLAGRTVSPKELLNSKQKAWIRLGEILESQGVESIVSRAKETEESPLGESRGAC